MILLDTSGLLAALDPDQDRHDAAAKALAAAPAPLLLSPIVLAELDFLVRREAGRAAQLDLLDEVGRGVYQLERFTAADVREAGEVVARHADLRVGLAGASIVVLARRHGAQDVLTLDERRFRVLQGPQGPFRLLPADA
ncbi:MAG TPA: PIN domain-containing protein [Gaiellaceae bacterium]|nr:PIN domain-containing protein [Gaiellaceae bacterium]